MKIKDCCKNHNDVVKKDQAKNFKDQQHQDNEPVAIVNSSAEKNYQKVVTHLMMVTWCLNPIKT